MRRVLAKPPRLGGLGLLGTEQTGIEERFVRPGGGANENVAHTCALCILPSDAEGVRESGMLWARRQTPLLDTLDLLPFGEFLRVFEQNRATPTLVRLRLQHRAIAPTHEHVIVRRGTAERAPERIDRKLAEVVFAGHLHSIASFHSGSSGSRSLQHTRVAQPLSGWMEFGWRSHQRPRSSEAAVHTLRLSKRRRAERTALNHPAVETSSMTKTRRYTSITRHFNCIRTRAAVSTVDRERTTTAGHSAAGSYLSASHPRGGRNYSTFFQLKAQKEAITHADSNI